MRIKIEHCGAKGAVVLLLACSFSLLSPLFGNARVSRHSRPNSSIPGSHGPTPELAPHPCLYVISSWVHAQDKSDDQDAQDHLSEAINHLLPDPTTVRAFTQKMWESIREITKKREKQNSLDHYDFITATETLDASTGKMTVEIYVHSVPPIPGHDFRLGSNTPVRIEGCTLPARNAKGERSCRNVEIKDIAEKIKAHDKEKHDQSNSTTRQGDAG